MPPTYARPPLVVRVAEVEDRHRVADELPVDQVVGAQDGRARRVVHGRAGVVVRVADADNLEVGEVLPDHLVGEPLLLGPRGRHRAHRRQRGARDQTGGDRHGSPAAVGVLEPGHARSASSLGKGTESEVRNNGRRSECRTEILEGQEGHRAISGWSAARPQQSSFGDRARFRVLEVVRANTSWPCREAVPVGARPSPDPTRSGEVAQVHP